jgi:hypothetical protein
MTNSFTLPPVPLDEQAFLILALLGIIAKQEGQVAQIYFESKTTRERVKTPTNILLISILVKRHLS